jgi:hypothetical protein
MASAPPKVRTCPTGLLLATALLTMAAVLVITLVPLAPCKGCQIRNAYEEQLLRREQDITTVTRNGTEVIPRTTTVLPPRSLCRACGNTGKMTLLKKWLGMGS